MCCVVYIGSIFMLLLLTIGSDAILCSHVIVHHYEREIFIEGNHSGVIRLPWCIEEF